MLYEYATICPAGTKAIQFGHCRADITHLQTIQLNFRLSHSPKSYPKPYAMIIPLCILDRRELDAMAERVNALGSYLDAIA
jgi:hypothetical protein